ncbi:MAG TPA: 30S ribosomal protein S12 methylthiotransferase RimO [Candidatus Dormibacteraeota bacterium]|jgi:ribosomal protein S12 methylthiotransferase|nr:30S ribosomal protein S12 methylthiotransferase RimO [Candidatus Dormibacteraeota bacterium]
MSDHKPLYFLQTLGCPKNQVDSGYIEGLMEHSGYDAAAAPEEADVCIVHTCGFLGAASQESIDALLELGELKKRNPAMKLVASGCLAQRHGDELSREMPELDVVIGTRDWPSLPEALQTARIGRQVVRIESLAPVDYSQLEFRPTAPATTYLKLSDGCNFRCAFCTIPSFTGDLRSKPADLILHEARTAVSNGVQELVLVAQNLTGYGRDLPQRTNLSALLRQLAALDPAPHWIRMMYATLEGVSDELIETMASLSCVAKYLDMPLQHVHPATLRRMKRPYSADRAHGVLQRLRAAMPDLALRSTFVVGFPGETEEEFGALLDFLPEAQLDWVTAFAYSEEPGTVAAAMPDQLPLREREARRRAVYAAQAAVSRARNKRMVGREITVLGEALSAAPGGADAQVLFARSEREAPEIDGRVVVRGLDSPEHYLDRFLQVRVTTAATYQVSAVQSRAGSAGQQGERVANARPDASVGTAPRKPLRTTLEVVTR